MLNKMFFILFMYVSSFQAFAYDFEPVDVIASYVDENGQLVVERNTDKYGVDFIIPFTIHEFLNLMSATDGQQANWCSEGSAEQYISIVNNITGEVESFSTPPTYLCPDSVYSNDVDVFYRRYALPNGRYVYAYYPLGGLASNVDGYAFSGTLYPYFEAYDFQTDQPEIVPPVVSDDSGNLKDVFYPYKIDLFVLVDLMTPIVRFNTDQFSIDFFENINLRDLEWQTNGGDALMCIKGETGDNGVVETYHKVTRNGETRLIPIADESNCPDEIYTMGNKSDWVYVRKYTVENRVLYAYYDFLDEIDFKDKLLFGYMFLN